MLGARYSAAPLGLVTVAALLPESWEVRLVDRNVTELREDDLRWATVVLVGGMLPQRPDALAIIELAHAAGKPVVMGGPDVTESPEAYAHADYRVRGEAEEIISRLVADIEGGVERGTYEAERFPDLSLSPVPRFDLLDLGAYLHVGVQFSRGCPFDCEFCSVIELNGRKPRVKGVEQIVAELEVLRGLGYRGHVDFVDDNLVGNRKALKPLLRTLSRWLDERGHPFEFTTEASLNLADDDELLALMKQANFFAVFVGIESPDPAALVQSHKLQNTRRDIAASVRKIHGAGMFVNAGFIIGFDAERKSVAEDMIACIEATSIPICMVGLLYALPGTQLARRLLAEGRLLPDSHTVDDGDADQCTSGLNFTTSRPREDMLSDYQTVLRRIYDPKAFFGRVRRACRELDVSGHLVKVTLPYMLRDLRGFRSIVARMGFRDRETRRELWTALLDCALHNPRALRICVSFAALYLHVGPFSRWLVERLETASGPLDEETIPAAVPLPPVAHAPRRRAGEA